MPKELAYDRVLHAQADFRSLLDALARPGTIKALGQSALVPPPRLNVSSAFVGFALLDAGVGFHLVNMSDAEATYLAANTGASPAALEEAAFVFTDGHEPSSTLEGINCGSLTYPDTSATIVIQVDALSPEPQPGGLMLTLEGPGIDGRAQASLRGLNPDLLLALAARNAEFPLGIDALVTCDDGRGGRPRVLGVPRTSRVTWDAC
jgi:alpha-D-ribose 1-methylphosphonate 5-triphosphate synthase subunit PhnH